MAQQLKANKKAINVTEEALHSATDFIVQMNTPGSVLQQKINNLINANIDEADRIALIIQVHQEQAKKLSETDKAAAKELLECCLKSEEKRRQDDAEFAREQALAAQLQKEQAGQVYVSSTAELLELVEQVKKQIETAAEELVTATAQFQADANEINQLAHQEFLDFIESIQNDPDNTLTQQEIDDIIAAYENAPEAWRTMQIVGRNQYSSSQVAVNETIRALTARNNNEEENGYVDPLVSMPKMASDNKLGKFIKAKLDPKSIATKDALIDKAWESHEKVEKCQRCLDGHKNYLSSLIKQIELHVEPGEPDDNDCSTISEWDVDVDNDEQSTQSPIAQTNEPTDSSDEQVAKSDVETVKSLVTSLLKDVSLFKVTNTCPHTSCRCEFDAENTPENLAASSRNKPISSC